jgi:hypothetical protein
METILAYDEDEPERLETEPVVSARIDPQPRHIVTNSHLKSWLVRTCGAKKCSWRARKLALSVQLLKIIWESKFTNNHPLFRSPPRFTLHTFTILITVASILTVLA